MSGPLLRVEGITKRFGPLRALDRIDLDVHPGEIHAILGENGAGKSTLMNVLYGVLAPDEGGIRWRGESVSPHSPAEARALGLGMVHQHFTLVPAFTVWENLWLSHPERRGVRLDRPKAVRLAEELATRLGVELPAHEIVENLPVGARQRVEIAKALCRPVDLLILDEPTAVLTPSEIEDLFGVMRSLREEGTALLFISHKLEEVREISDRVTVLRNGRVVGEGRTVEFTAEQLTRSIVGEGEAEAPAQGPAARGDVLLAARSLTSAVPGRVPIRDVSFELAAGEILGVTGVDGNGQEELAAALAGLAPVTGGRLVLRGEDVTGATAGERWRRGLSVLPTDRGSNGVVGSSTLWENLALREFGASWARGRGGLVKPSAHRERAARLLERHGIRSAGVDALAGSLSGGNQQKLLLAREQAADPAVLVFTNPTRGLDVGATAAFYRDLDGLRSEGKAILLISTELDEVMAASDRCAVLSRGRFREVAGADRETLGALMLGAAT